MSLGHILHTLGQAATRKMQAALRSVCVRERRLKIGVDIRSFYEPLTGIGWYLHFLLQELAKRDDIELVLFGDARVTDEGPHLHAPIPPNARLLVFDLRGGRTTPFDRTLTAAAYVLWMELEHCDVVFGANFFLPRLHSAVARRRVVTIHDLTWKRYPELLQKETLMSLERHMTRELARADAVICVSESTRRDLLAYYPIEPSRAVVIHSGLGTLPEPAPVPALPERYILFVSTIEPRKNLGVLLDAYQSIRDTYRGSLVVVGRVGWKSEDMQARLRGAGVIHLDYLSAAQLATVYAQAEVFVLPSIHEGFGFPLLEAMAHGIPCVASRSSSLPEIGGDAALYFEPSSVEELAEQLRRVTTDTALRAELTTRGLAQAARFTWTKAAAETFKVLRRVGLGL